MFRLIVVRQSANPEEARPASTILRAQALRQVLRLMRRVLFRKLAGGEWGGEVAWQPYARRTCAAQYGSPSTEFFPQKPKSTFPGSPIGQRQFHCCRSD